MSDHTIDHRRRAKQHRPTVKPSNVKASKPKIEIQSDARSASAVQITAPAMHSVARETTLLGQGARKPKPPHKPTPKPAPAPIPAPVIVKGTMPLVSIAILNVDAKVSDAEIVAAAAALSRQAVEHFGPAWDVSATVRAASSRSNLATGEWIVELHDQPPADVQGALGFHDRQTDGTPILYVFAGLCAEQGVTWTSCASHEICEALADPYLRRCVQAPDGQIYALEVCDACETVSYKIDGVEVSDFCLPAYFEPEVDGNNVVKPGQQYDYCKSVSSPFQILNGGYGQVFDPRSGWTQLAPGERRAFRTQLADAGFSRFERRKRGAL